MRIESAVRMSPSSAGRLRALLAGLQRGRSLPVVPVGPAGARCIVGVAGDVHDDGPKAQAYMEIYRPHSQFPYDNMALVVRGAGDPAAYATPVRNAIRRDRSRSAPRRRRADDVSRLAFGRHDATEHRAIRFIRRARARARCDRHLRRDDVHRPTASPRDRHSSSARRIAGRCSAARRVAWGDLSLVGIAIGLAGRARLGIMRCCSSVFRRAIVDVRGDRGAAGGGRSVCRLEPGSESDTRDPLIVLRGDEETGARATIVVADMWRSATRYRDASPWTRGSPPAASAGADDGEGELLDVFAMVLPRKPSSVFGFSSSVFHSSRGTPRGRRRVGRPRA